jgi:hypothetical protein
LLQRAKSSKSKLTIHLIPKCFKGGIKTKKEEKNEEKTKIGEETCSRNCDLKEALIGV